MYRPTQSIHDFIIPGCQEVEATEDTVRSVITWQNLDEFMYIHNISHVLVQKDNFYDVENNNMTEISHPKQNLR